MKETRYAEHRLQDLNTQSSVVHCVNYDFTEYFLKMCSVHVCVPVCGGQRIASGVISQVLTSLILETASFTDLRPTKQVRLAVLTHPNDPPVSSF